MQGRVVNAEDYQNNRKLKMLVLTCDQHGEVPILKALKASTFRSLRIAFSEKHNELRIILPDVCFNVGKKVEV